MIDEGRMLMGLVWKRLLGSKKEILLQTQKQYFLHPRPTIVVFK